MKYYVYYLSGFLWKLATIKCFDYADQAVKYTKEDPDYIYRIIAYSHMPPDPLEVKPGETIFLGGY